MTADLRIGTSGYSFRDWVGTVYPPGTRASDMLPTYARDFDGVEINFTYYRDPTPEIFAAMLRKVDRDFEFVVKAPAGVTHERDRMRAALETFLPSLQPLMDAGQLGAVLAQFPQSFHHDSASIDHLKALADALPLEAIPTNVEFRHDSWNDDDVYERLRHLGFGFVNVDLPELQHLPRPTQIATSDVAYFRLHGRNAAAWHHPKSGSHRYDYLYRDDELDEWAARIEPSLATAQKVYVFNNNCHKGSSFVDALRLKQRLGQRVRSSAEAEGTLFASDNPEERILDLIRRVSAARTAEADD
jgi:uncharacterized protein YecE (DUF72 family)